MSKTAGTKSAVGFLSGGGEMGKALREKDWSQTPVGVPASWPPELRTVIRLMLTTNHPIFVFWGDELTCFYNDAYSHSIGPERHPQALGMRGRDVWEEIWDIIGPQIEMVMSGRGATWNVDHLVPITRHGAREDVYWTYSYSPIDDPSAPDGVGGVLVICTETTKRIQTEQRLKQELENREVLLEEVNHRIKNSLQLVSTLLRLESRSAESDQTRASLRRASARVDAIASVHELIYRTGNIETVPIKEYIGELCNAISDSLALKTGVTLQYEVDDLEAPTDFVISLALLINELVTNAFKHAFPDGRHGQIRVSVRATEGHLNIEVIDNGVGKPEDVAPSLGSRIIRGLTRQLSAQLSEGNDGSGYCVQLRVPLER